MHCNAEKWIEIQWQRYMDHRVAQENWTEVIIYHQWIAELKQKKKVQITNEFLMIFLFEYSCTATVKSSTQPILRFSIWHLDAINISYRLYHL